MKRKTYRTEVDSCIFKGKNSGSRPDILITLTRLENGMMQFDAWRVKRDDPTDGEGIAESEQFPARKTFFWELSGLSIEGFPRPIFFTGTGKRSGISQRICVMNKTPNQ